jgi:hypothetical protein
MRWLLFLPLLLLLPMLVRALRDFATPGEGELAIKHLGEQLARARQAHPGRAVREVRASAGADGWSVELLLDPPSECVELGRGARPGGDFAAQLRAWARHAARELGATAVVHIDDGTTR